LVIPSDLLPLDFPSKTLHVPLPMQATCPANLFLLDLISRMIFDEKYRILSSSLWSFYWIPLRPKYLLYCHLLEYPEFTFLPQGARPSFATLKRKAKLRLYIPWYVHFSIKVWKKNILHWMIASFSNFNLLLIFFIYGILVC
jgi:hypothetical protein